MSDLGGPYDTIVIGAGISGLTAANVLAREGQRVLLLEQHQVYGGYMQRFALHGTVFDSGCHYVGALGEGQVFDRYLRYLGVRDRIRTVALDPDGFDVVQLTDGEWLSIPVGRERFAERLIARFPAEAEGIRSYFAEIERAVAEFPMFSFAADKPQGGSGDERTLAEVLDATVRDPKLRSVLQLYGMLYFVPPEEAPFALHALVSDSFLQGAYTIDRGGFALTRALLARFRELGGVTKRRRRVVRIDVEDRRVRGVQTAAGEVEQANTVIACIDPKITLSLLPPGVVRPAYEKRIERLRPGIGAFCAYLRVDAPLDRYAGQNYFLMGEGGADALFHERWVDQPIDPPVFVTVPSARESRWRGPQAVVVITAMTDRSWRQWSDTTTGARDDAYERRKREIGEQLLRPARRLMPELRGALLSADFATPLTHRDYTLNSGGAIYGIHHSIDQVGVRGVGARTRVRGLWLSGHSVLYPGLLGATISAFHTCGHLVGLDTLYQRLLRV